MRGLLRGPTGPTLHMGAGLSLRKKGFSQQHAPTRGPA